MKNYRILIKPQWLLKDVDSVKAENPEDAMTTFAFNMDTDMNQYFMAVPENKFEETLYERENNLHRTFHMDFYLTELKESFDTTGMNDEDLYNIADTAYDMYCEGDGRTEYDCLTDAYNEHQSHIKRK